MKVIIAGSHDGCPDYMLEQAIIDSGFDITELVCGMATGVDAQAEAWARGLDIPVKRFPADWAKHGRVAGPIRNTAMAEYAQALIALPGGARTFDMIRTARRHGLRVHEVRGCAAPLRGDPL